MKIYDITLHITHLALKDSFTTALRSVDSIDEVMLILHTATFKGYGSAPATLAVTGDDLEKISSDLREILMPSFKDYELNDYDLAFMKLSSLSICKSAQTTMDIALHDLFAKRAGQTLYAYLGGKARLLETLYTISINTPQKMLIQANKAFKGGYKKLKIKLDGNVDENIKRVRFLHEHLKQAELFLDINQAFTLSQTKLLMEALKDLPILLLEQPLQAKDLPGMHELTALHKIPILADESVFSYEDAVKAIEMQACDFINIKLMKCGGIYEARRILDLCLANGMQCMIGSMLESGISVTAALHLAYAYENVIFVDLDGPTLAADTLIYGGIAYHSMELSLNEGLGLGIEFRK